ncbi:major capsid protein [Streptacidiphilus cavernicola]|uniref:Major capsid protein n=1 Tax=Streptacidiphilus cavernicola TaxID=3342716 RepID=A0ABV6VYE3_9ACTN
MSVLDNLLDKLAKLGEESDESARQDLITAAVTAEDVDLAQLSDELAEKSATIDLSAEDVDISTDQLGYLQRLAEVGQGVSAEVEAREAARQAEERRQTAKALAEKIAATRRPPVLEEPAEPEEEPEGEPAAEPAAVAASATAGKSARKGPIPLGGMRSTVPDRRRQGGQAVVEPTTVVRGVERFTMTASGDGPGTFSGQEFPTLAVLTAAAQNKVHSLSRLGTGSGRAGIATFTRQVDPAYLIEDEMRDWAKLESASNERLLPGGSLVAALQARRAIMAAGVSEPSPIGAGLHAWCSPMDILTDLCPLEGSLENMIDLPTLTTLKGGVMWPKTPDYSDVFKDQPFCFSYEDMSKADFEKPCVEIPCETGWEQCILEACSFCIVDNILLSRIDDTLSQRAIAQGLYLQRRALNAKRIRQIENLITAAKGDTVVTADELRCHGPGMFEAFLSYLSLQAAHLRATKRLPAATTFEVVAPAWLLPIFVTDISKKLGIDNRWSVTEAQVAQMLAAKGFSIQWVWEFQDAGVDKDAVIGGTTVPKCWPDKVKILMFQAGSFQAIQGPSVQLDAIYDSVLLKKNKRVRLFVEDMTCLIHRCGIIRSYELPLCPNGMSGSHEIITCPPGPVPLPEPEAEAAPLVNGGGAKELAAAGSGSSSGKKSS